MTIGKRLVLMMLAGTIALGLTGLAGAAIIQVKDSTDFDFQYEMGVSPELDNEDPLIDPEWKKSGTASSVLEGVLTYNSMPSASLNFYTNNTSGGVWPGKFTLASGFTVETRIKVLQGTSSGTGFGLFAGPGGTDANAYLVVGTGGQGWNSASSNLGTNVNNDDFHVFRVAQEPGAAKYSVWRDGILLDNSLGVAYSYPRDGIWFGDGTGSWSGEVDIDYMRFTEGAHAPGAVVDGGDFSAIEARPDAVHVRFDEFVSNPQPGGTAVNNGIVASFSGTFDGFFQPDAANTTVSPLPDAVGVLVESSTGQVLFSDDATGPVLSDMRGVANGGTITFTFGDPDGSGWPAVVSAVGFRFGSVFEDNVTASFYDLEGNLIDLTTVETGVVPYDSDGNYLSSDGYISYSAGLETPLIHKVVLSGDDADLWLLGSFYQSTALNDMVFSGFTPVPEPSTFSLLSLGLAAMLGFRWRRRR